MTTITAEEAGLFDAYKNLPSWMRMLLGGSLLGGFIYLVLYRMGIWEMILSWMVIGASILAGMWSLGLISEGTVQALQTLSEAGGDAMRDAVDKVSNYKSTAKPIRIETKTFKVYGARGKQSDADVKLQIDGWEFSTQKQDSFWVVTINLEEFGKPAGEYEARVLVDGEQKLSTYLPKNEKGDANIITLP